MVEGGPDKDRIEVCRDRYSDFVEVSESCDAPHIVLVLDEGEAYILENVFGDEDTVVAQTLFMLGACLVSGRIKEVEGLDAAAAFLAKLVANCL